MRSNVVFRRVARAQVERAQGLSRALPQRTDQLAVVGVRDLARAVIELELLQRGKRAISFLRKFEPALPELIRRREPIFPGLRLTQERERDEHDANDGEDGADDEREGHIRIAVPS
jgi:hypothetical protein